MKFFHFLISGRSKNKNLWLSLFFILFLNVFWVQEQFFTPTERGSSSFSSHSNITVLTQQQLDLSGCTSSPLALEDAEDAERRMNILSNRPIEVERSIRPFEGRQVRLNYRISRGDSQEYSGVNVQGCVINGFGRDGDDNSQGFQARKVTIRYEREINTECDVCDTGSQTQTAVVYVLGSTANDLQSNLSTIFARVVEKDLVVVQEDLRARSLAEDIERCVINPETNEPYGRTHEEQLELQRCRINRSLNNARSEGERERIRLRFARNLLRQASGFRALRNSESAITHLGSLMDSDVFSDLPLEIQDTIQGRLDTLRAFNQTTTQVCLPSSGCENLTAYEVMERMVEARRNNDTAHLNSLHTSLTDLSREVFLNFNSSTFAGSSEDYRNSISGDVGFLLNSAQNIKNGDETTLSNFESSQNYSTASSASNVLNDPNIRQTFSLIGSRNFLLQFGLTPP